MSPAQIDLQQLRIKHILYKSKVRSVVYGGTYDQTFFSRLGPVGTWFETIGLVKYPYEPEMQELVRLQNEMDNFIATLFYLHKTGRLDEAYEGLSKVENYSERFLELVGQMEQRLNT